MKLSLFLSLLITYNFNARAVGFYYINSSDKKTEGKIRMAYPTRAQSKETFYGSQMAPGGLNIKYSPSYIRIMKLCYGLSTNSNKMMERAITSNDEKVEKRLTCYTRGLGNDLTSYRYKGLDIRSAAQKYKNQRLINYIEGQ